MPNINDAINKGRQWELVAEQKISGTYLTGVAYDVLDLPVGSIVVGGHLQVETAATGVATGGTAVIATVVTADIDMLSPTSKFVDDLSLLVANVKEAFDVAVAVPPATVKRTLTFTPTVSAGGGAAGVTVTARLIVNYVLENRATEVQPTTP